MTTRPAGQQQLFSKVALERNGAGNTTVFLDNMSRPVHRWFRYSAGFSATWVEDVVRSLGDPGSMTVFDPFVGSGTTCIAAQVAGARSIGIESHPFVARVARAKLNWSIDPALLLRKGREVLRAADRSMEVGVVAPLLRKCFEPDALARLISLRESIKAASDDDPVDELLWLALVSVLRRCSPVGTAQWQYVLPNKSKSRVMEPYQAFHAQLATMAEDMRTMQLEAVAAPAVIEVDDARVCKSVPDGSARLLITSPPYPNNFDYADATRIEMTFLGDIEGWGDLQEAVRKYLVRSCSQHMTKSFEPQALLSSRHLEPIVDELRPTFSRLQELRITRAGHKAYDNMIVAYFHDLARVWHTLRRIMTEDSRVCFVVGDSAPYGVHVPVDRWLGELAVAAGFRRFAFEKLRDRNTKWKNRKHRIPLHEGRLWVEG